MANFQELDIEEFGVVTEYDLFLSIESCIACKHSLKIAMIDANYDTACILGRLLELGMVSGIEVVV